MARGRSLSCSYVELNYSLRFQIKNKIIKWKEDLIGLKKAEKK